MGVLFWVIWFIFPLALEMRNLRPTREVTQYYLVSGWQGHLGSCLLCPSQLRVLPTLLFLSSVLLISVQQVWAQTESPVFWAAQMSASPKEKWASSWSFQCMSLGSGWWAASPWHSIPHMFLKWARHTGKMFRDQLLPPFKNFFLFQVQGWNKIMLEFCIPWNIPS